MAGDNEPKGLFNNSKTLRLAIKCVNMLVKEAGLEFLRANFFLILLSILPKFWQRSKGEGLLL